MKLSVLMITYNHDQFIAKALDSILMQEVDFDYEIVIGEDCSTDATRRIVLEYQQRYPDKVRPLLPETNIGMTNNFVACLKACRGEYVAILEGDDYWSVPDKLQLQVDYLEAHPECAISFHNCEEFYQDGAKASWNYCAQGQKKISTLEDLIAKCNFIPTCAAVFRNRLFPEFPDWYFTLGMGDWTLHILNAEHGDIAYIDRVMSRHRHHYGGVWSLRSQSKNILDVIKAYKIIDDYLGHRYTRLVRHNMSGYYYHLAQICGTADLALGLKYLYASCWLSDRKLKMMPELLLYPVRKIVESMKRTIAGN